MFAKAIVDANSNLTLSLENEDDRQELADYLDSHGSDSTLVALLENYSCNGSYTFFNAGDANPFVGLTEAPCIAESMDTDEEGKNTIYGEFWCYVDYMVKCPIETILDEGSVTFTHVGDG